MPGLSNHKKFTLHRINEPGGGIQECDMSSCEWAVHA